MENSQKTKNNNLGVKAIKIDYNEEDIKDLIEPAKKFIYSIDKLLKE